MLFDAAVVLCYCVETQAAEDCHLQEASVLDGGLGFEQLANVFDVASDHVDEVNWDRVVQAAVGAEVQREEAANTASIESYDGSMLGGENVTRLRKEEGLWASQSGVVEVEKVGDVDRSVDGLHLTSKKTVLVMGGVKC